MSAQDDLATLAGMAEEIGRHGRVALGSTQYLTTERGRHVATLMLTLSTTLLEERSLAAWAREEAARVEGGLRDDVQRLTDELLRRGP